MSKPKVFEKPSGVRDYLPYAVYGLRTIEKNVIQCMENWGYQEIITPTLEYYDTVGMASLTSDHKLFKLLDKRGTTLVLRTDNTAPIARVVSSLLKDEPLPMRLSYHSNVFRAMKDEAGRDAEFVQTGAELIGDGSPDADAEIIALAISSIKAAGIENFKIALGHMGFLQGLFKGTSVAEQEEQRMLKEHLLNKNYVGYKQAIKQLSITKDAKQELEGILKLRGGKEICEQAKSYVNDPATQQSINHLCEVWEVLEAYGVSEHVVIDLTMLGDFSYYTGMTFEGYAGDLGFPVCSGGRYDNLLTQFGRPAPATGFALKTNRILEVVSQNSNIELSRTLILYDEHNRINALKHAQMLRNDGQIVETRKVNSTFETTAQLLESYTDIINMTKRG
ncbi:ATP phosphoribosyltransferase regulatory subunit [Chengkuizengella axinellae]|uniref:ATP phosphoribosyltransferase regulatory subunit n=1 Tax=Chengkuizengella axinellae TaxID=3064388 RepID=A0ABT9J2H8_9BACL|nr:ATP phosphoribosyltransferase regulatory subunit [Chengkuizengella sp. 2205SS18-9]MDP5275814.1 ATP phosphoribosyltransferase regulatory subunit [Chengkuizengella sp. 2205SS18-9]